MSEINVGISIHITTLVWNLCLLARKSTIIENGSLLPPECQAPCQFWRQVPGWHCQHHQTQMRLSIVGGSFPGNGRDDYLNIKRQRLFLTWQTLVGQLSRRPGSDVKNLDLSPSSLICNSSRKRTMSIRSFLKKPGDLLNLVITSCGLGLFPGFAPTHSWNLKFDKSIFAGSMWLRLPCGTKNVEPVQVKIRRQRL